jgi:type VI secretion system protein ImpH
MPLLVWRSGTARKLELALETLLGDAVPPGSVRITQMCGEWVQLDSAQGMRLGRATARLGLTSVLGNRAFDRSGRYRITVGPLRGVRADDFMPGGPQQRRVAAIARQLIREPLDFDLEVLLGAEEHSGFALRARTQGASALGKGTWLRGGSNLQRFVVRDAGKVSSATHPSSHPSSQR